MTTPQHPGKKIPGNTSISLLDQLNRTWKHIRQGSYGTRDRYRPAARRFCIYLGEVFHLQKLSNMNGKHMTEYVIYMQDEKGYAPSTIKTELSAIRFLHDHLDEPKYRLPGNDELRISLERRTFGNVDRTWSGDEFEGMVAIAERAGRRDYVCALYLARYVGLRLHETYRIDTAIADNALRTGNISIIGKNGKPRTVPIENEQVKALLKELRVRTERGHKLLVQDDVRTDIAMRRLEQFIAYHRGAVQNADSDRPMTYHGLRHTFAAEKYKALLDGGMSTLEAHLTVSQLLGHNRADVTDIYLASVKKGKEARDGE